MTTKAHSLPPKRRQAWRVLFELPQQTLLWVLVALIGLLYAACLALAGLALVVAPDEEED